LAATAMAVIGRKYLLKIKAHRTGKVWR
jgi:hypothetical protein